MDHLIVKIRTRLGKKIFKLISDQTIYEDIPYASGSCVSYEHDHNLDEDSWFQITNFLEKDFCIELLKKEFDSIDYNDLEKEQFENISYLCSVQNDNYYFQKVTRSLFLSKKLIAFGETAYLEETSNRLQINNQPDAIYYKRENVLVFKNIASISSIFKGIDQLYKEATEEEVSAFLQESFVEIVGEFNVQKVSKPNRKRIALARSSLSNMTQSDRDNMLLYVNEYCGEKFTFDEEENKFEIPDDETLKWLLYGIEQRYYTTPFNPEKRLANSVQKI